MSEEIIREWMSLLPYHEITVNMMQWMQAYEEPCNKHCCFSSMCAVIKCNSCLSSLTALNNPSERYICIECSWEDLEISDNNDDHFPEGCPELCELCFRSSKVLHWHKTFCRIDNKGRHSLVNRSEGFSEKQTLTLSDLVVWPTEKQQEYVSLVSPNCCICLEPFLLSEEQGSLWQIVSPPGCKSNHLTCLRDQQHGCKEIPATGCCGKCMYEGFRSSGKLLHCKGNDESGNTIFYPSYCKMCEHLREMGSWHEDFCRGFLLIRDGFCQAAHEAKLEGSDVEGSTNGLDNDPVLPVSKVVSLLEAAGKLPSCAVPNIDHIESAAVAIDSTTTPPKEEMELVISLTSAFQCFLSALADLHPQPFIQKEAQKSMEVILALKVG